jgi:hypothetical protein
VTITDDDAPATPATDEPKPVDRTRSYKFVIAGLAALCLALAILAASLSATNRNTTGRSDAVRNAASSFGQAFFTYDYQHLARGKAAVLRASTGSFKKQYTKAFDGGLDTIYKQAKASSKVKELNIYLGEVSSKEATVMLEAATVVTGVAGKDRPNDFFVLLGLVHTSDGWLVDSVTNLNIGTGNTTATTTP